ncbi:MAG: hypothetical protein M1814_005089 [Vezdaea aestivalis]|nr:MAG: hypothetical protein M1814_005089 [Vezdaea aestivalis]
MFPSFTGSSKKPRQINLSGRNNNPFLLAGQGDKVQSTVATAQQARAERQKERDRQHSSRLIQRVWRGYRCRECLKDERRRAWDSEESSTSNECATAYISDSTCLRQLLGLLRFVSLRRNDDLERFNAFVEKFVATKGSTSILMASSGASTSRFLDLILEAISVTARHDISLARTVIQLTAVNLIVEAQPVFDSYFRALRFYRTLAFFCFRSSTFTESLKASDRLKITDLLSKSVMAPLMINNLPLYFTYESYALGFLTTESTLLMSSVHQRTADQITSTEGLGRYSKTLAEAILTKRCEAWLKRPENNEGALWLLSRVIALFNLQIYESPRLVPEFIEALSLLLGSLADHISPGDSFSISQTPDNGILTSTSTASSHSIPDEVRKQIDTLPRQKTISQLLERMSSYNASKDRSAKQSALKGARILASYALILIRIFKRQSEQIKMWLYLASPRSFSSSSQDLPPLKYFWQASRSTRVFSAIMDDPSAAKFYLKEQVDNDNAVSDNSQDFRLILLFLEIYSLVLKITDDEEFFSAGTTINENSMSKDVSWTRRSVLPLKDVKDLTLFLKNLAFTLYWNAAEIRGTKEKEQSTSLSQWFQPSSDFDPLASHDYHQSVDPSIAGVKGITLSHLKHVTTGLLRVLYDRDSRRQFLPTDHWLMTSKFEMQAFITDVVAEERNRRQVEEADEEDRLELENEEEQIGSNRLTTIRITHGPEARSAGAHTRALYQRQLSRQRYLEAVTPRLEIVQNMPFFIPFETRVKIFRQFVTIDQLQRRHGQVDPDMWRMSLMANAEARGLSHANNAGHEAISKHHAQVRRESVFEDAYDQFYTLGDGLKEPIQITFVDKFDFVEPGIDGGGVTKEFLTSITNEALRSEVGYFIENDQHLLYPNPSILERKKQQMQYLTSAESTSNVRDIMKRYEFLGRVIGKCLYEGILLDVGFVGFFLLKWALTGGTGAAPRETTYRASLNDLRDLDEALYQGLLKLKNYDGNVEDFSLDFTVTDDLIPCGVDDIGPTQYSTHELKEKGSSIAVTNDNRIEYIYLVARYRLQIQPVVQTNAFLKGLGMIIQPSWLAMFNQNELQTLVSGTASEIDVADLREHTLYGGVYVIGDDNQEHPTIQLFWQVMQELSDKERRQVLKFVTSTPRAPLLGFNQLNPWFSIRDSGRDEERLPSTSTCVNLLKLPQYSNVEQLKAKLLYSINSGAGFNLS